MRSVIVEIWLYRVTGYLKRCSVARMAASAGLFLSVPIFLLGMTDVSIYIIGVISDVERVNWGKIMC